MEENILRKKYHELFNYNKNDTVATGLERPKTTSLFFDKIWVPPDFKYSPYGIAYGFNNIPSEICIEDKNEKKLNEQLKIMSYAMLNKYGPDVFSCTSLDELINAEKNREVISLKKNKNIESDFEFLYSNNRNIGIRKIVANFRQIYGIEITPLFINKTKFEECISASLDEQRKDDNCNALEVSINYIPTILEDQLTWEQVLNLRRDKVSKNKLKRLKYWINLELKDKSRDEIVSLLDKMIDDYKFALTKHGILTTIGGFSSILTSSSTVIEAITEDFSGVLSAGFVITAGIITFTTSQIIDLMQTKREPIAFIYDVLRKV